MYKSSPFTFIFKFFFPVFMISGVILGIYNSWTEGTPESLGFAKAMLTLTVWILIFLIQMPFRLKTIETTEEGIIIKDFWKKTLVSYKDIDWITKFDLNSPWFITIQYNDRESGNFRKISFIPNNSDRRFFSDDAMTQYIKNKVALSSLNCSKDSQPSQIKNLILILLLSLPFILLALFFLVNP